MPEFDADGNEITGANLADLIEDGEYDAYLSDIREALNNRRVVLGKQRARKVQGLPAGTRVKLVNVSPKAAEGATGTLDYDPISGKMGIRLDRTIHGRRHTLRADHIYTWPAQCYEAI